MSSTVLLWCSRSRLTGVMLLLLIVIACLDLDSTYYYSIYLRLLVSSYSLWVYFCFCLCFSLSNYLYISACLSLYFCRSFSRASSYFFLSFSVALIASSKIFIFSFLDYSSLLIPSISFSFFFFSSSLICS